MATLTDYNWDIRLRRQYQTLVTIQIPLSLGAFPLVAGLATSLGMESQTLTVPYRGLVIALAIMTIALSFLLRKRDMYQGIAMYPLMVFVLAYTARLLADTVVSPVPTSFEPYFYWLFFFGTGIIPMVPLMIMTDARTMRRALLGLLAVLALAGVLNLYAATQVQSLLDQTNQFTDRLGTDAVNPISVGHLGTSLTLLGFFLLYSGERVLANRGLSYLFWIACIVFGTGLVAMAASRGPQLALLITVIAFLTANYRRLRPIHFVFLLFMIVLGYIALMWVQETTIYAPLERLRGLLEEDESVFGRREALANAWDQFLESPIFGSGLEEKISMFYPHNIVVESFMATGIVGGIAFCLLSLYCFNYAFRSMKTPQGWIGMLFFQYYIGNLVSGAIFTGWYLWVSIGIVLGWAQYHRRVQSTRTQQAEPVLATARRPGVRVYR